MVDRYIRGFSNETDELVYELQVLNVDIETVQRLFDLPANNPAFDCYPLQPEMFDALSIHILPFYDFENIAYFLECDARPNP